jgi:hypothetical protein
VKDIAHMIGIYNQKPWEAYFCMYAYIDGCRMLLDAARTLLTIFQDMNLAG